MISDLDLRRAEAAISAWYAPETGTPVETGDVEDMLTALAAPSVVEALRRWAYKQTPDSVPLPVDDVRAMARAMAAAAEATA